MLSGAKNIVTSFVMMLAAAVVSLPSVLFAATSPSVAVLAPLSAGLSTPLKMALDSQGNIFVADQRIGGVVKFNAYREQLLVIKTAATPTSLAFAQDGSLLVSQTAFVARYNPADGEEIGRLAGGELQSAAGIAVDDVTGYIYVTDSRANQVVVYTASGSFVKAFGKGVTADSNGATVTNPFGKLSMPTGIAFEKKSRLLAVADTLSNRIQFFDVEGNFVKSVGNPVSASMGASVGPMQFAMPVALAFEYSKDQSTLSRMYVVDSYVANVQVFGFDAAGVASVLNVAGTTKNYIGSVGTANGQLMVPSDVVFDSANGRLMVVNGFGNVTNYGIDGGKHPIYVDVTPPLFTLNQFPAEVKVNSLTISGTVEIGSSVQVSSGTAAMVGAVVYSPGSTSWSLLVTELAPGNNSFTVTAKDVAGNTAAPQFANVNYILPAPSVALTSSVPPLTNTSTLELKGTVDAGSAVSVANGSTSASVVATVTGTDWSATVVLAEGANSLTVSAQKPMSDKASVTLNSTLDTVPPVLSVSAMSDGSRTANQTQNITGTVSDRSAISVLVNNSPVPVVDGTFSLPVTLVSGANTITVIAGDQAGNVTLNSRSIIFDSAVPVISITAPMDNSYTSNSLLRISGTLDESATVKVGGVPASIMDKNNWYADIDLVAGINTIEVVATDLTGNASTMKRSVTLDTLKPVLAISTPAQDLSQNLSSADISGSVSDDSATTLTYSFNGTVTAADVVAGSFAFKVDFVADGIYPVAVTVTDSAGNRTTAVRNIVYDTVAPLLTVDTVVGAMPLAFSGTVEPGSVVTVREGTASIGKVTHTGGTWTADLNGMFYNPSLLNFVATDAAGNTTVKLFSPTLPVVEERTDDDRRGNQKKKRR